MSYFFFFQAEDGIRDLVRSRGLGDVYKRQIQAYASEVAGTAIGYTSDSHPYFFIDTNANGTLEEDEINGDNRFAAWTPRLLTAAYNYQTSLKDPGAYAHGGKYIVQLLYDSIASLNEAVAEPMDMEAMRRAAGTASRIGASEERPAPVDATPHLSGGSFYSIGEPLTGEPAARKVALLERADRAARAFDPSIARLDASIGDELKYVMVARSDGKVVGDIQPLIRFNVSALSQKGESRQIPRTGGGGRLGTELAPRPEGRGRPGAGSRARHRRIGPRPERSGQPREVGDRLEAGGPRGGWSRRPRRRCLLPGRGRTDPGRDRRRGSAGTGTGKADRHRGLRIGGLDRSRRDPR